MRPLAAIAVVLLTACGPVPPSADTWPRGEVEQPDAVTAEPSSTPAYCAPCHPAVITELRDVAALDDGFLAIGSRTPATGTLWRSADGRSWTLAEPLPDAAGARLEAVAIGQRTVVVGSIGPDPAIWVDDGDGWTRATVPRGQGRMTAVTATDDGFIAGGYLGPEFGPAGAAIWRSPDGTHWTPVDIPHRESRVAALAATASRLVAVGRASSDDGAASWASDDGVHWERSPVQASLDGALMLSVTPFGARWVAVGTTASGEEAAAWTSDDGLTWTRAPSQASFHSRSRYAPHAEMSDVTVARTRLVAVGWNSSGNGAAVVWTSTDGVTWTREPDEPGFSGGGMHAVTLGNGKLVAVGSTGWPDTHAATTWSHDTSEYVGLLHRRAVRPDAAPI